MDAQDLRKRATRLMTIASRLKSRDVAATLNEFAEEMLVKADYADYRSRRGEDMRPFPFGAPATLSRPAL